MHIKKALINIIIVDDNPTFLKGISAYINSDDRYTVIASLLSGVELLKYKRLAEADIILLDIEMPDLNGIETAKKLNFDYRSIKIIAVTMYQDKVYLNQLIEAGFKGFVNKAKVPDGISEAIETVMNNQLFFPQDLNIIN